MLLLLITAILHAQSYSLDWYKIAGVGASTRGVYAVSGTIDLKDEALDLKIETRPKDVSLGSLRVPIFARGSFSDPKVSIEGRQAGFRLFAAAILGLITPAAAVLPFIEPGDQAPGRCRTLAPTLAKIQGRAAGRITAAH